MESHFREMGHRVRAGRVGEAHEHADLVVFPGFERGAFITGTAINLDGGMAAAAQPAISVARGNRANQT